jgi:hypothetical protein
MKNILIQFVLSLGLSCAISSQVNVSPTYTNPSDWHKKIELLDGNFYDLMDAALKSPELVLPAEEEEEEKTIELARFYDFWHTRVDGQGLSGSFQYPKQAYSVYITYPVCKNETSYADWKYVSSDGDSKVVGDPNRKYQKMGIVISLAKDPNNNNIVYAGSNTGGLFKTTNFNDIDPFWECITENEQKIPGLGISNILLNTENGNNTIYITSELMINS